MFEFGWISCQMCRESSHAKAPQASKCLHEPIPPHFLSIYHLCDPFKCEYGKTKVLLGPIAPYYKIYVSISTYGTSRLVKHYLQIVLFGKLTTWQILPTQGFLYSINSKFVCWFFYYLFPSGIFIWYSFPCTKCSLMFLLIDFV